MTPKCPTNRLKIAMISLYLPGEEKMGVGYQAHGMANALTDRRHIVTMFSRCRAPEDALYQTTTLPVGSSLTTFRFAWNLRQIDFSGYDIVHAHTDDYFLPRSKRSKASDSDEIEKRKGLNNSVRTEVPRRVRTMHGSCLQEAKHIRGFRARTRMLLLAASEQWAVRTADRTVCVSRNTLRSFPSLPSCQNKVIPNGIDLSVFRPCASTASSQNMGSRTVQQKSDVPSILFVGTYHNRKRGKLLMAIFASEILPALPEAQLWMVTDDAPDAPNVTVTGRIPTSELAELYRKVWLFCLPSSYEGFGVPYLEAMASGTPVVATPNVGAIEVLCEGRYGRIVPEDQLGAAILDLLRDAQERQRLSERGLARAREFDWSRIIDRYEQVYAELLSL